VNGEAGTIAGLSQPEAFSSNSAPARLGLLFAVDLGDVGKSQQRRNSVRLYPNSQRHLRSVAILVEARRRRPMRAYVTAAGMGANERAPEAITLSVF
jgi:hypothetical protein